MKIRRRESWGWIEYDTTMHRFTYSHHGDPTELPYASTPVVLNCDLTLKCNMSCRHCVAHDMTRFTTDDLAVSEKLLKDINRSPFMVVVVTGGEPLLPDYETALLRLVNGLSGKGIAVDTNGTIEPSDRLLRALIRNKVLLRVSLDSLRPQDETVLRQGNREIDTETAYNRKLVFVPKMRKAGVRVAVQSVLHQRNSESILDLPPKLRQWGIDSMAVQRLIPTRRLGKKNKSFLLPVAQYESVLDSLAKECAKAGVRCLRKRDRRHNSVFLMVGDGMLYTQSEAAGKKIPLGKIGRFKDYFEYVSASEHSARYYAGAAEAVKRHAARPKAK